MQIIIQYGMPLFRISSVFNRRFHLNDVLSNITERQGAEPKDERKNVPPSFPGVCRERGEC